MLQRIKDKWFKSRFYKLIERIISNRFRRKLVNENFTILCSNCIGGVIYHRLGMEFKSPTINLWLDQREFLQFCLHLDDYLRAELRFVDSEYSHPVGVLECEGLPSITLNFAHYKSNEEAAEKWNSRKLRINKDNLYIILFNADGITEDELQMLNNYNCKNKVLLNWKEMPEIPWSVHIDFGKKNDIMQRNIFGLRVFERNWDFISFLNK